MVKGLQRALGIREVTCPTSPSDGGTGPSPVPDLGGCWHLLYLVQVSLGCRLPNRCCWEEEEPWGHGELVASLLCVWSPLHKPGPEGFCGKGHSLLEHVSASLSVAAAVALLWANAVCSAYWLEIAHSCSRESEPELSYLQRLFKWKLQTPLHPPITLFNLQLSLRFRKLLKHAKR